MADVFLYVPSDVPVLVFHAPNRDKRNIDFKVCWQVVLRALIWLKQNNKLYESITIDINGVEKLPEEVYLQALRSIQINLFVQMNMGLRKTKKVNHPLKIFFANFFW